MFYFLLTFCLSFPTRQNGSEEPLPRESPKAGHDIDSVAQGAKSAELLGGLRVGREGGNVPRGFGSELFGSLAVGANIQTNLSCDLLWCFFVGVNLHSFKKRLVLIW